MLKPILVRCLGILLLLPIGKQGTENDEYRNNSNRQTIGNHDTKETAFAKKLVHCFKSGNVNEWMALFPTDEEYRGLLLQMIAAGEPGVEAAQVDEWIAQRKKEAADHYTKEFEELQRRAKAAGLNWSAATYSDFIFDRSETKIGNQYLNGDIELKAAGNNYVMEGIEALETRGGYRLQALIDIKKIDDNE